MEGKSYELFMRTADFIDQNKNAITPSDVINLGYSLVAYALWSGAKTEADALKEINEVAPVAIKKLFDLYKEEPASDTVH